ncbi:MAG: DUF167 domain-containing protein [Candidatus Vogelbacteria bacterium]|nr:DUF167 domain-containing protein [Candidatus Vogelbacteria bacterium]
MYIKVHVIPKSKKEALEKKREDSFIVRVREPAERNLANERVCELIAREFKVQRSKVRIINGHVSPSKLLSIAE